MKECTSKILATAVLTALAAWSTPASAGFPFLTDDPGTQGIGKWEIDIFSQYARARADSAGAFAAVQVNYGLTDNFDLQAQAPWAFAQANGVGTNSGIGDAQAGFKFRFVDEDKDGWRPAVAFVPAVIAPTGSAPRGLGAGYTRAFLPVWLSKSFGELRSEEHTSELQSH